MPLYTPGAWNGYGGTVHLSALFGCQFPTAAEVSDGETCGAGVYYRSATRQCHKIMMAESPRMVAAVESARVPPQSPSGVIDGAFSLRRNLVAV